MKDKYIDATEVPKRGSSRRSWPWQDILAIPAGKALELTASLDGRQVRNAQAALATALLRDHRRVDLRVRYSHERIWIVNEGQP